MTSPSIATLVRTAAPLPTTLFPEVAEGTGTGCSVCSRYDAEEGELTLVFRAEPVPPAYNPMIVADDVRYAPPAGSLADLVTTKRAVWKLPAKPYPAAVVLNVGYERAGKMVSSKRTFEVANDILEVLADLTVAGDMTARRELLRLLMPWIKLHVTRTLGRYLRTFSEAEIEDLIEDVLVRLMQQDHAVLRKWVKARGRTPLRAYIARVARNLVVDCLRKRRMEEPLPDDLSAYEGVDGDLEMRIEAGDYRRVVFARLEDSLSGHDLEVLELAMAGHGVPDIAEMAGMTTGAVHSWQSRMYAMIDDIRRHLDAPASRGRR